MISYCTPSFVSKLCFRQGSLESDIFVCSFSLSLSHSMWPTLMRVQRTWEAKRTCGENSTWMVKHHLSTNLSEIFTLSHPAPLSNQLPPPPPNTHTHTVLPCHSFLHNIVVFLERAHMPGGLSLGRLQSFKRPPTQAEQIEHIKAVTSMR